jgi:hypothetical protein
VKGTPASYAQRMPIVPIRRSSLFFRQIGRKQLLEKQSFIDTHVRNRTKRAEATVGQDPSWQNRTTARPIDKWRAVRRYKLGRIMEGRIILFPLPGRNPELVVPKLMILPPMILPKLPSLPAIELTAGQDLSWQSSVNLQETGRY